MIIDFRVRPPYKSLGEGALWNLERRRSFAKRFGQGISSSIEEKSMDLLLQEMDELGIDKGVVQVRLSIGMKNEDLASLLKEYPSRFVGMIGVTPWEVETAFADIDKYIVHGTATGIIIEHGFCNPPITADDGRNYPIYELCQRLNIPVTLSFGGFLGPNVDHNTPKMIDKVAADFPDLVFILAHGGWPYVQEMAHVAFNRKNVYLSPDIYAVNVPGSTDYIGAMNYFIPEKMIFGSAYPVIGMKDMVDYYKEHLSKDVYDAIMYQNAAQILNLK